LITLSLCLSVNKSFLKEQILTDLFHQHLATCEFPLLTPEEILMVTTRAFPSNHCMHPFSQLHGYPPNVNVRQTLFLSFFLSLSFSLSLCTPLLPLLLSPVSLLATRQTQRPYPLQYNAPTYLRIRPMVDRRMVTGTWSRDFSLR
jgi:hypothetical protein